MTKRETAPPADLIDFCQTEYDPLVRFLSLYCGQAALAEELAQEALIRACRGWSGVRKTANPRAWLRRVAVNCANSYFRRGAAERRARARLEAEPEPAPPSALDHEDVLALRQAMGSLSSRQRAVLLLRYFDDLPISDIAQSLECSDNTVKSLLKRGLARLRETDSIKEWKEALRA